MTHFNFILSTNISINTRAIKKIKNLNKVMWSYKIEKGQLIRNVDSNHQRALKGWCVIQGNSEGITESRQSTTSYEDANMKIITWKE